MTLVELMVTVAVVSILSVALAGYLYRTTQMNKAVDEQSKVTALKARYLQNIANPEVLKRTEKLNGGAVQ
jgi:prepilin-type N-terminal cleavage/methylation domain-containing protein